MASVQKIEGKKGVSFKLTAYINGDRKTKTWKPSPGMTKRQAEKEAKRQADNFQELLLKGISVEKMTFKEVADKYLDYIEGVYKPTTVKSQSDRIRRIIPFLGHVEIKRLTKQHIRDFIHEMEKPYTTKKQMIVKYRSAETINDYYKTISCVLTFACESDYIEDNICLEKGIRKPVKAKEEDKGIPIDVMKGYIKEMSKAPLIDKVFFHLALSTGMRKGEILGLAWTDVDLEKGEIMIHDNAQYIAGRGIIYQTTKRKASDRRLEIPEHVTDLLGELKCKQEADKKKAGYLWHANTDEPNEKFCENHDACRHPCKGFCGNRCRNYKECDRIFVNELGNPIHPDTPRKNMQKIGRRAGLPVIAPHDLRHTAASLAIGNDQPLPAVAAGLGHKNPKTTMAIYAHALKEREQARKLNTCIDKYIKDEE